MRNRLCCEVEFGKQSGVEDRLLHRSDAISGSLFSFISEPKNASNGGLVSALTLRLTQTHLACFDVRQGILSVKKGLSPVAPMPAYGLCRGARNLLRHAKVSQSSQTLC